MCLLKAKNDKHVQHIDSYFCTQQSGSNEVCFISFNTIPNIIKIKKTSNAVKIAEKLIECTRMIILGHTIGIEGFDNT